MTTSPLANLSTQTAELLAAIAALESIEQLRDAEPLIVGKRSILSSAAALAGGPGARGPAKGRRGAAPRGPAQVEAALEARRAELSATARTHQLET